MTVKQHELAAPAGVRRRAKRVGRGLGSGKGTTAGKGQKGQKARAGGGTRPSFEGGQLPIVKRLPEQRGFRNRFRVEYQVVNLGSLARLDEATEVSPREMLAVGLLRTLKKPVKILGEGEIERALKVRAHKFSASAREKIGAAGGTAEEIDAATAV